MRDTIRNKIKLFFAFLIILFLLPYIISVFINGKNAVQGADSDNASVYLAEMLAGETDGGCEIEALKAQAVVLRTELYRTEKEKQTLLDKCLTQTQMKKKWGTKYEENLKKCQQAVQETKGIVLWYHETFAWTPFHQSSNGKTRDVQEVLGNADYPYITAKECPLDKAAEDEIQSTASSNTQNVWFTQESTLAWPASGATLLSFSMDHTVYFPTLEQYKYNPALIIGGTQGEVIHAAAAGVVESIEQTAQTGTTVTLDMGNGYTAVYGQLDEVAAAVGDYIAAGEEVGTLNSPTKYYSVEGPNLYFEIMKDGAPVDPMNFME